MSLISERFSARGSSFISGTQLLIDNSISHGEFDEQQKTFLRNDIKRLEDQYNSSIALVNDFKTAKFYLDELLKQLILLVQSELHLAKEEIFRLICEADKFAIWEIGRNELKTEFNIRKFNVIQIDEPICNLSHDQKREFLRVSREDFPEWYKALSEWQRKYLKARLLDVMEHDMDQIILTIPSSLQSVPGLINYSMHILELKDSNNELIFSSHRFCASNPSPISVSSKNERRRLAKQNIMQLIENQFVYVNEKFLNKWQPKIELGRILNSPVLIQTLLSPIVIDIFAPIFYPNRDETKLSNDKEYVIDRVRKKLSSERGVIEIRIGGTNYHIEPIVVSTNYPINFLRRETLLVKSKVADNSRNGAFLLQCICCFLEEVVLSKFNNKKGYHAKLFKKLINNKFLPLVQNESILFGFQLSLHLLGFKVNAFQREINICLNSLNLRYLTQNKPDEVSNLNAALTSEQISDLRLLLNAVRDYVSLYNTVRKWTNHKEMFLSALEEIIADRLGGISFSSSLFSRNRKGLQTIHTDAMLIYQKRYGVLPLYDDNMTNRRRFVEIFVDLFFTGHQQKHAGQNAPGTDGLHEIIVLPFAKDMYMIPKDIVDEINKKDKKGLSNNVKFAKLEKLSNPFSLAYKFFTSVNNLTNMLYGLLSGVKSYIYKLFL